MIFSKARECIKYYKSSILSVNVCPGNMTVFEIIFKDNTEINGTLKNNSFGTNKYERYNLATLQLGTWNEYE